VRWTATVRAIQPAEVAVLQKSDYAAGFAYAFELTQSGELQIVVEHAEQKGGDDGIETHGRSDRSIVLDERRWPLSRKLKIARSLVI
jgi:hypothetical protein